MSATYDNCKFCRKPGNTVTLIQNQLICAACGLTNGFRFADIVEPEEQPVEEEDDLNLQFGEIEIEEGYDAENEYESTDEEDCRAFSDYILSSDKTRRQINQAEEELRKLISKSSLLSRLSHECASQLVQLSCLIFGNCTRIWSIKLTERGRHFQLPKDIIVRLCASFIYSCQCTPETMHRFNSQHIICEFSNILEEAKGEEHIPFKFQSNVYKFIRTMQEYRLWDINDNGETIFAFTPVAPTEVYRNNIRIFANRDAIRLPQQATNALITIFDHVMRNQWLAGQGPNMAGAAIVYHNLIDKCERFRSAFVEESDYIAFMISIEPREDIILENIVEVFLVDLKKSSTPIESFRRGIVKAITRMKESHNCF